MMRSRIEIIKIWNVTYHRYKMSYVLGFLGLLEIWEIWEIYVICYTEEHVFVFYWYTLYIDKYQI